MRQKGKNDAQIGMLMGIPTSAICVQRLDDSRKSAIHINYRILPRSSSLREPRYPLLRVVTFLKLRLVKIIVIIIIIIIIISIIIIIIFSLLLRLF